MNHVQIDESFHVMLYLAILNYHFVGYLLDVYESVTYLHLSIYNQRGCSAFLLASKNGHLEVVKFLLEKGAKIKNKNRVR
jgi:ankyrin repeat protein